MSSRIELTTLQNIIAKRYDIVKSQLPEGSSKGWPNELVTYDEAVPFVLAGNAGLVERKQLNWLSLFLLDKIGGHDYSHIEEALIENSQNKLTEAINKLPEEIASIIYKNPQIIQEIKIPLELQIAQLKLELQELKRNMNTLMNYWNLAPPKEEEVRSHPFT